MRTISKYISFALMAFAVVACHTNEIDNPDNPDNPNPPQISDNVTFTASIKQTRVEYTPNGDKLDQCWKVGDVIYGFYGEGSGSKIILQVTNVDSNGYAKLEPLYDTGPDFVAALKESVKNKKTLGIGLIYTGKTISSKDSYRNPISIGTSFLDQSTGQIPACMSCILYDASKTDEDGNTIVEFKFKNDCAILEIKGITGAKEEADLSDGGKAELISITVTNTCYYFIYSYDGGTLSLGTDTGYLDETYVETESLYVDSNGNIVDSDGNSASVMIAVVPNDFKKDINVTAKISGDKTFGSSYNTAFAAGTCYVIRQKDVVAKTEDGLYFTSVSGAFDHAAVLAETLGNDNTVTLVKDLIFGLDEDVAHATTNYDPTIIDINYAVTLDLNGCTLSLDCLENNADSLSFLRPFDSYYGGGFNVWTSGTLTIIDEEDIGYIDSCSECPIINNSGTVNIEGGNLFHWYRHHDNVIYSTGDLNVSGGNLYAFASPAVILDGPAAEGIITGGLIENDNDDGSDVVITSYETIQVLDGADCTISGGVIHSYGDSPTIGCRSVSPKISSLTITWPTSQDDAMTDKEYGEYIHEPLIYAAAPTSEPVHYYNNVPISAYDASANSSAVVSLQGGYLISNPNLETFFCGDGTNTNNYINLDFNNNVGFYSNKEKITWQGSGNGNKKDLYNKGSGQVIQKGTPPLKAYATFQGKDSSFTMPIINEDSGDLWYIYK